ncbi:MAG: DUF4349 domain-containing protein [Actinomycetota bacterium]
MIKEDDLRRLLSEAADSVPAPGRAPEALLASLGEQAPPRQSRRPSGRRLTAIAAALLAVVALGGALASTSSDDDSSTFSATGAAIGDGADEDFSTTFGGGGEEGDVSVAGTGSGAFGGLAEGGAGGTGGGVARDVAAPSPVAPIQVGPGVDSAKIVKTGSLDLEVRKGAFDATVARIGAQTTGLGGYIAESTTSESSDTPSGSIVVRVPSDSFETLLAEVRKLGDVKAVSSKGTDVTAQFTDLAARLTALTATRDRLSTVLSEAENVPDILAVQDRITSVQVEIEQLQGQQRLLEDQTSFATLAITLGEPGSDIIEIQNNEGLGHAWDEARRRFGDSLERIVSWSGSAAVVFIVGLILLVMGRILWIALRRRLV